MGRALYYSSYSKLGVWNVGFLLYLLMMVEAFLGYFTMTSNVLLGCDCVNFYTSEGASSGGYFI